jgi:N-carbamoylputrescine amidase
MLDTITVAAVQMNALRGDLQHNLSAHRRLAQEAVEAGANLVVFPELSTTAHYGEESVVDLAEEIGEGIVFDAMMALAAELNCSIGYGICERDGGVFYNSYVIMGRVGVLGVQRKVHASLDEYLHFRMGGSLGVFNVGGWKVAVAICVDAAYFEAWRIFAINGADLVLLPHAGRSGHGVQVSESDQRRGLKKRVSAAPDKYGVYAEDNAVFAVFCNQVGYNGHSTPPPEPKLDATNTKTGNLRRPCQNVICGAYVSQLLMIST